MDNKLIGTENNIVFYEDENNNTKVEVRLQDEDVWLNVNAIANLFNVGRPAITKHINNIYNDQELNENSTCSILEHMCNGVKVLLKIVYSIFFWYNIFGDFYESSFIRV